MTYQEFKNKWLEKGIDYDGSYGFQCMDVYRMFCKEVLECLQSPPVKGAKEVWTTYLTDFFTKIKNTPDNFPKQGDVVIWDIGTYGHIAICDHADLNSLTCFEQNWSEGGTVKDGTGVTELRTHNYKNILGWLRPKMYNIPSQITTMEQLPKDNVIKDIRMALCGKCSDDEIKADLDTYENIRQIITRICTHDENFYNLWIAPEIVSQTPPSQLGHVITEETTQPTSQEETTLNSTVFQIISRWIKKILGL